VQDKKEAWRRKKHTIIANSGHVECNSLDGHWPFLTKIIGLIMWVYSLVDVHASLGIKKRKTIEKQSLI